MTLRIRLDMPCGQASRGDATGGGAEGASNGGGFTSSGRSGPGPACGLLRGAALPAGCSRGRQWDRSGRAACCAGSAPASASTGSDNPSAKACGFNGERSLDVGDDAERRWREGEAPAARMRLLRNTPVDQHTRPETAKSPRSVRRTEMRIRFWIPRRGTIGASRHRSGNRGGTRNMLHRTTAPSCAGDLPDADSRRAGCRMRPVGHVRADHRNEAPSP